MSLTTVAPGVGGTGLTAPGTSGNILTSNGTAWTSGVSTGICKAWVNFNGVTTATVRASFNVSSVIRNATGQYTLNFTTAFANANYSTVALASANTTQLFGTYSTTQVQIYTAPFWGSAQVDSSIVSVAVFSS